MSYIKRDIEGEILELSEDYACILLTGPRQVGKTTVLRQLMTPDRHYVTLDDIDNRKLAGEEPALFLQMHDVPVLIDEVQYAPQLFSYIKIAIDNGAAPGSFWLTGSQAFGMMNLAQESLAGRTAILHMPPLSQHEIYGSGENLPFTLELNDLKSRISLGKPADVKAIYERIWQGSLPGYISKKFRDRHAFYSSYLQTYIERDVGEMTDLTNKLIFSDFIRAAACRTGQLLNVHDIATDVGVSDDTARRWLQILEKSEVIFYLRPYSNNLLKRTVKTPKMYFFDTGLVAYLTQYSSPDILMNGAISGAILENFVVSEIRKSYHNAVMDCLTWYYRDKNGREIDLIIESDGQLHPMEIKRSANPGNEMIKAFSVLDKGSTPRGKGAVICMKQELSAVNAENYIVPAWMI